METLYTASDRISSECMVGTREEWKAALSDSFKIWHQEKIQKEELDSDLKLDDWIESQLDENLTEASDDQVKEYKSLD